MKIKHNLKILEDGVTIEVTEEQEKEINKILNK